LLREGIWSPFQGRIFQVHHSSYTFIGRLLSIITPIFQVSARPVSRLLAVFIRLKHSRWLSLDVNRPRFAAGYARAPIADIFGLDFDVYVILAIPITGVLRPNASYK
jgi:hypothetical protein